MDEADDRAPTARALTVSEAARLLAISESHCRNLIRAGQMPHARFGRRIVVPASAIDEMLSTPITAACGK